MKREKSIHQLQRELALEKKRVSIKKTRQELEQELKDLKNRDKGKLLKKVIKSFRNIKLSKNPDGQSFWSAKPSKLTNSLYNQKGGKIKMTNETAQEIIDKNEEEEKEEEDLVAPSKEGREMLEPSGKEI